MARAEAAAIATGPGTPPAAWPQQDLVAGCLAGDEAAFEHLVRTHEARAYGLALRLLGDAEEARDVCQEVFLQVFRTLPRFEGRASLRTWIFRIVVNHSRNHRRWWQRRGRDKQQPLDELTLRHDGADPEELARRREREGQLQAALGRLSFDHRSVLLLREVEGLSCEEIAAALEIAMGTVKSRLARARDALRDVLLRQGGRP